MSSIQSRSASVVSPFERQEVGLQGAVLGGAEHQSDLQRSAQVDTAEVDAIRDPVREATSPAPVYRDPVAAATPHPAPAQTHSIAPIPRIAVRAFCESHDVLSVLEYAAKDRLMSRAHLETYPGGIRAAVEFFRGHPAPNLVIVESRAPNDVILAELEGLADVCDPGTRVMVIGHSNDIGFYRELMRRRVSEYAVAPIGIVPLIAAISGIYRDASAAKLGQVYAFVGAKGGVGSSTVAHNVGWSMARRFGADVVLADLDLPFGTASLDFNLDVNQGIAEAIQDSSRLDEVLLDRLLTKCDDHFSLLAAPATLDRPYDLDANAFETLLEIAQANVPFTILDIPHLWTSWARNALVAADEIVITAAPDLANLRNVKNLIGHLKQARPHDAPPKLILNQVGMAKRPEIKPKEFASALEIEPLVSIPFDAHLFGTAANNGKMVAGVSAKSPAARAFSDVAASITGRREQKRSRRNLFDLGALIGGKKRQV